MSEPENNESKGVNIGGESEVNVGRDAIGGDQNIQGDSIHVAGDANVLNTGPGTTIYSVNLGGSTESVITPATLAAAKEKYLEFVIRSNSDFIRPWIVPLPRGRTLNLDDIYVSLGVEPEVPKQLLDNLARAEQDRKLASSELAKLKAARAQSKETYSDENTFDIAPIEQKLQLLNVEIQRLEQASKGINIAQAIKDHSRLVILGNPGAGKSTLTRYLAFLFASTLWSRTKGIGDATIQVRDKEGNEYGTVCLPIRIRIVDYATKRAVDSELNFVKFISHRFEIPGVTSEAVGHLLSASLSEGNALVLLDGLDEVDDVLRTKIRDDIKEFVDAYHRNRFVATSRKAGYYPIAGFIPFTFSPLKGDQLARVFQLWSMAILKAQHDVFENQPKRIEDQLPRAELPTWEPKDFHALIGSNYEQFAKRFASELESNMGARRLMENPLTLTMLVELLLGNNSLPPRRGELYRLILDHLLDKWEKDGRSSNKSVSAYKALGMLSPLAYWLHESTKDGTADENEIKRKLEEIRTADEDVDQLWISFRDHTPLFTEYAHGHYGFAHRTFQEYLVSKELLRPKNDPLDRIYQRRHQVHWEEPILLALSSVPDATELIRTAILAESRKAKKKNFGSSLYDDVLHRDFFFAVRCVADGARIDRLLSSEIEERLIEWKRYAYEPDFLIGWPPLQLRAITDWESFKGLQDQVRYSFISLKETEIAEKIRGDMRTVLIEFSDKETEDLSEFLSAYEILRLLGNEYDPEIIRFYFKLERSNEFGSRYWGGKAIEFLAEANGNFTPSLLPILSAERDTEIGLEASILLAESGQMTLTSVQCLFRAIADDDWVAWTAHGREEQRAHKLRERAFNALSKIEETTELGQNPQVIAFLLSVIDTANKQIEQLAGNHPGRELYEFLSTAYPHDMRKLIAAYLMARLGGTDSLPILEAQILEPKSGKLYFETAIRLVDPQDIDAGYFRKIRRDATIGSSQFAPFTLERYASVYAAKRLASLQTVSEEIVDRVLDLSKSPDRLLQRFAITLLHELHCKQSAVFARLMHLLMEEQDSSDAESDWSQIRGSALSALYGIGDIPVEYLPQILDVLKNQPALRFGCLKILADGKICPLESTHREIAETLLSVFETDESDSNLEEIEHALGYYAVSPEVMLLLIDAFKSDNKRLHAAAYYALITDFGRGREIDPRPGAPPKELLNKKLEIPLSTLLVLVKTLTDSNAEVSQRALYLLERSSEKPTELTDELFRLLKHSDSWVQCRAIEALVELDCNDSDIVPICFDLVRNKDPEVRSKAMALCRKLPLTPTESNELDELEKLHLFDTYAETPGARALLKLVNDEDSSARVYLKYKFDAPDFMEKRGVKLSVLFQIVSDARILVNELDALSVNLNDEEKSRIFDEEDLGEKISEFRETAIWKIGEEANLENETISLLVPLLDDLSDGIQASAIGALAKIFTRFPVGFQSERREFADRLYEIIKHEDRGIGDAWPALWKVAQTL